MAVNPTPPAPRERIWTAIYVDSDTECFEIQTVPESPEDEQAILFHKEYSIGTAIGDFLAVDLSVWEQLAQKLQESIDLINEGQYTKKGFNTIFYCTLYWLDQSAFFAPFAAALQRLQLIYEAGSRISLDDCNAQMEYYRGMQTYLRELVDQVFTAGENENTAMRYFSRQARFGEESYPSFSFDNIQYTVLTKGTTGVYPYDEFMGEDEKDQPVITVAEMLETEDPYAFSQFLLYRYLRENVHLRKCKYCGRMFATRGSSKVEYCDRLINNSTKTCREMGSLRLYEKRKMEDPAIREYKRAYKTHNARIRYGLMTREEFTAWSVEARARRDACCEGRLSLEDFVEWLDSDKPQK